MKYQRTLHGKFISRPNRFIAYVAVDGTEEKVHVKNTGRCRELLVPGAEVILEESDNPNRKTKYDLIAVYKEGLGLVNIDSQAPNQVVEEWLRQQDYSLVHPEYTYGSSRVDFYMEKQIDGKIEKFLLEIKGCTLEIDGIGYFPDAPTARGVKHLTELTEAAGNGWNCGIGFAIQMPGVREVRPNMATHPEFGMALQRAEAAGVKVVFFLCEMEEDEITVREVIWK